MTDPTHRPGTTPLLPDGELKTIIRQMPAAFTVLDFADRLARDFPQRWNALVERYGLYGSGTRYSALTYFGNRLSSYSRRAQANLLEPTPQGWTPVESRFRRRSTPEERERFGSRWIVVYRRHEY